jgi:hypothetical protein
LNQLLICLGILAALLVNVALPVADWRTMFLLAALPAAALLLGAWPDSLTVCLGPNSARPDNDAVHFHTRMPLPLLPMVSLPQAW